MAVAERRPEFTVSFEGPAFDESSRMDVNDLAPALLALADVFHRANELTSPGAPRVNLEIRALQRASFDVLLSVVQAQDEAVRLLTSPEVDAVIVLLTLLGYVTHAFDLVGRLGRRRVSGQEALPNGETRISFEDGTTLVTQSPVVVIATDPTVRAGMKKTVAPLAREGIDRFRIDSAQDDEVVVIESNVLPAFEPPIAQEVEEIAEH